MNGGYNLASKNDIMEERERKRGVARFETEGGRFHECSQQLP